MADADWPALGELLHPDFTYVNAQGMRLDRTEYLSFVAEGPLRWPSR